MTLRPRAGGPVIALILMLAAAGPAGADDAGVAPREMSRILGLGPSYRAWNVDDSTSARTTISQFQVPVSLTIPVGPAFDLVAYGAYAHTTLKVPGGSEATLAGLTDFRAKGVWRPGGGVMLSAGVNLPVGKRTLSVGNPGGGPQEADVAQAMWSPLLGFRTGRMGEGFDLELDAGYARALSPTATLGLGAGYVLKGQYDLFESPAGVTTFKPGAEMSASLGLDVRPVEGTLFRVDVAGRGFTTDRSNDADVYKAGTQFELEALFARDTGSWWLALRGRNVSKGDDETISGSGSAVTRTAVKSISSRWGIGEFYYKLKPALALGAEAQFGSFGKSELVLSDGTTFAIGPGVRIGSPDGTRVSAQIRYLTGSASGGSVDLSGVEVSSMFSTAF